VWWVELCNVVVVAVGVVMFGCGGCSGVLSCMSLGVCLWMVWLVMR